MKYNLLIKMLWALIYIKRFFWRFGTAVGFVFGAALLFVWRPAAYLNYKISYFFKKLGIGKTGGWFFKRDYLQVLVFVILFFLALPQTTVYSKIYSEKHNFLPGQDTIAYTISGPDEEYSTEVVTAYPSASEITTPSWSERGVLASSLEIGQSAEGLKERDLSTVVAGGSAFSKPIIMPGSTMAGKRDRLAEYVVGPGDSLSSIAYKFDISVTTILWENKLTARSIIRVGDKLNIPPATGVMHLVKKGETIKKIATLYNAKVEDIIKFNKLKENGSDLAVGEKIMVPDGVKKQVVVAPKVNASNYAVYRAAPPSSQQSPGASGFIWPSGVRYLSQYYSWKHHALDIAGPFKTPTYAAKSGVVEVAQCGWNSGYGCYVIINHGDGSKTLYGHHSILLVSPGEYVRTGQTIALMGNTGKVRGATGIHLHFEIIINGVRVNPLGYVR